MTTKYAATYVREPDIQKFVQRYTALQQQARTIESSAKNLDDISAINYKLVETLNGFLQMIRGQPAIQPNSPDAVLISLDELRMLESEMQLRLIRATAVQQAKSLDLGELVVSNVDANKIQNDIKDEVKRLNEGGSAAGGSGSESDDTKEEQNPLEVDLENSNGLYSIIDAMQAPRVEDLIGYTEETDTLLNLTKKISFVGRGINETTGNNANNDNRPVSILLYGPPGTGKTTSAQAVARSLGFTYMYVNAENVTSMWAGGTQKNISKIFRRARIAGIQFKRKTLLLIDEIDGLLKNRQKSSSGLTGEEYSRITTFLQMLTPPVGIDNSQIVCMFTTNNLENLDPAFVNRARQAVFFGYVVRPLDRGILMHKYLQPYTVTLTQQQWIKFGLLCPEFVPRDVVNMTSLARVTVSNRYETINQTNMSNGQNIVIPLDDERYQLTEDQLYELRTRMNPATPINSYFTYDPPPKHTTDWLRENGEIATIRKDVWSAFENEAKKINV